MKAAVGHKYASGEAYDKVITLESNWPKPKRKKGQLLVKVLACSLAPGDIRVLSGWTKLVQSPPGGLPYVLGGDLVGTVQEVGEKSRFKVGDCIVARFSQPPNGALAEYAVVDERLSAVKPESLGLAEASTVANSPMVALRLAKSVIRKGDRVMVLGGAGGVGSHLVQLAKRQGAAYVAATSNTKHIELLKSLGVDRAVDYTKVDWSAANEFKENPFDVVIDLAAEGKEGESKQRAMKIVKSGWQGGRSVTLVGPSPFYRVRNWCDLAELNCVMIPFLCFSGWTRVDRRYPHYFWYDGALAEPIKEEEWKELFGAIANGQLKVVLDPAGPFKFTKEDICKAYRLQETRHVQGKVVILLE